MNKFFEGLPIYFVNLESEVARKNKFVDSLVSYGIKDYKRIDAFDGRGKSLNVKQSDFQVKLEGNQAAIILSYIRLLREFLNNESSDYILMCDDDVDFFNSVNIDFNFYDTLKYHKPELYNLKVVTLDILTDVMIQIPPDVLIKPTYTSYGQATIINKQWVEMFLDKYHFHTGRLDENFLIDLTPYTQNLNNTKPDWIHPAIDAINFDEHAYLWRVFSCFPTINSLTLPNDKKYCEWLDFRTNDVVLNQLTCKNRIIDISAFKYGPTIL